MNNKPVRFAAFVIGANTERGSYVYKGCELFTNAKDDNRKAYLRTEDGSIAMFADRENARQAAENISWNNQIHGSVSESAISKDETLFFFVDDDE